MTDRLTVKLQRDPIAVSDIAGRYELSETSHGIWITDDTQQLFVRHEQARDLAYGLLGFLGEIDADHKRYVRLRDRLGRSIRNGSLEGFDEARVEIDTQDVQGPRRNGAPHTTPEGGKQR